MSEPRASYDANLHLKLSGIADDDNPQYVPTYDASEQDMIVTPASTATHHDAGKPRIQDLDPDFLLEMGMVMTQGLTKYPNDPDGMPNWWKGGSYRSFVASILRHTLRLACGQDIDPESGLPHTAHIAVDASFVRSWQARGVGTDDRLVSP